MKSHNERMLQIIRRGENRDSDTWINPWQKKPGYFCIFIIKYGNKIEDKKSVFIFPLNFRRTMKSIFLFTCNFEWQNNFIDIFIIKI